MPFVRDEAAGSDARPFVCRGSGPDFAVPNTPVPAHPETA